MRSCQENNDTSKVSIDFSSKIRSSKCIRQKVGPKMLTLVAMSFLFITVVRAAEDVNKYIDAEVLKSCVVKEHRVLEINERWPVKIGCSALLLSNDYYSYSDYYGSGKSESQCVIQSAGSTLYSTKIFDTNYDYSYMTNNTNNSYIVDEVFSNMNGTIYKAFLITDGECTSISYTLIVKKSDDNTICSTAPIEMTLTEQLTNGQLFFLTCTAKKDSFFLDPEQYKVTWYKNCNKIITNDVPKDAESTGKIGELKLTRVDFNSAGDYTCSVTYKNTTRYLTKIKTCVKYESLSSNPYIRQITPEVDKVHTGSDVTLTCGGTASNVNQLSFAIIWLRNYTNGTMQNICTKYLAIGSSEENDDSKYDCSLSTNSKEVSRCYTDYKEAKKDKNKGITRLNSSLKIKNFQKSDEGQYMCRVVSTRGPQNVSFEVTIKSSDNYTTIIIVLVAVLLFITCIILIVVLRRNCIHRYWKKRMEKAMSECDSSVDNRKSTSSESSFNEKELPQDVV